MLPDARVPSDPLVALAAERHEVRPSEDETAAVDRLTSLNALRKAVGGHEKLLQQLRRSDLTIDQLARNARMSVGAVMKIWYFALDRAAIVEARLGPVEPRSKPRVRRTKRARRVLRDLVL